MRATDDADARLLSASDGLATVCVAGVGEMRAVASPIRSRGRRVGTLRVADPLTAVEDAQDSLLGTFAMVGLGALGARSRGRRGRGHADRPPAAAHRGDRGRRRRR
jgi:hypothetical protein